MRKWIGLVLAFIVVAAPLAAEAQQAAKNWRIGLLGPSSATASAHLVAAFLDGLHEHGYVDGRNVTIEYRWADGQADRLPALAKELVDANVDVIVSPTPPATRAAKNATSTIPIVMLNVADPVAAGLVADVTRPSGNVTGQTNDVPGLGEKLIGLVREMVPSVRSLAVLRNPTNPSAAIQFTEVADAARAAGVDLHSFEVRAPSGFETVFDAIRAARPDVLLVRADPMFFAPRKRVAELAVTNRIPTLFERREYAEAGGLVAYGPSLVDQFRHAATFVDRILKGARPSGLPIEPPARLELVVNLKTAATLGLALPPSLVKRADHLIE